MRCWFECYVSLQVTYSNVYNSLNKNVPAIISIFAGRANTGIDPEPTMEYAVNLAKAQKKLRFWASSREVFNIIQAQRTGTHMLITGLIAGVEPWKRSWWLFSWYSQDVYKDSIEAGLVFRLANGSVDVSVVITTYNENQNIEDFLMKSQI